MTSAELQALWIEEGGSRAAAPVAAAIALAESGGCRYALAGPKDIRPVKACVYRFTTIENSIGLWQINHNAHPQFDEFALFDPHANARAAIAVSGNGNNFRPWTTYVSGAYKTYLAGGGTHDPVRAPTPRTTFPPGVTGPVGLPKPVESNPFKAWHQLTMALASTVPTQARRARRAKNKFTRAIR